MVPADCRSPGVVPHGGPEDSAATDSYPLRRRQPMYVTITRRTPNRERQQETLQRAGSEFFPTLQQAAGFLGFYLIAAEDGLNTAITVWQDRAKAEAFQPTAGAW